MQALVVQSEIAVDYINDMPIVQISFSRSKPYHRIICRLLMGKGLKKHKNILFRLYFLLPVSPWP